MLPYIYLLAQATAEGQSLSVEEQAQALGSPDSLFSPEGLQFVLQLWRDGGELMIPLAILAVFIYFEAMSVLLRLKRAKLKQAPRAVWEKWLDHPEQGTGHVGQVIRFIRGDDAQMGEDNLVRLQAVGAQIIPDINLRIGIISTLVNVAPLMGLLGTVLGMLSTFRGLSSASGQAADLVAEGIRVALITTQTGLMIAIPGYLFLSLITRERNRYSEFLTQLETALVQRIHRQNHNEAA